MQKAVKKRPILDEYGFELSKKIMKKLADKEKSG
jgi:hypothetical protein